jgi:hypothetical protein
MRVGKPALLKMPTVIPRFARDDSGHYVGYIRRPPSLKYDVIRATGFDGRWYNGFDGSWFDGFDGRRCDGFDRPT